MSAPVEEFHEHAVPRLLSGNAARAVVAVALAFSSWQLVVAAFHPLSSLVIRAFHVGFLLALTFLLYPRVHRGQVNRIPVHDYGLAALSLLLAGYHWIFEAELVVRSGDPSVLDLTVGALFVALVFEASRRVMGNALPLLCAVFLAYGLFGEYLPGALCPRGYGIHQIIASL